MADPLMVDLDHMLSVTEANARGVSRLARDAEHGIPTVIIRNNRLVAAVVPMAVYHRWLAEQAAQPKSEAPKQPAASRTADNETGPATAQTAGKDPSNKAEEGKQ